MPVDLAYILKNYITKRDWTVLNKLPVDRKFKDKFMSRNSNLLYITVRSGENLSETITNLKNGAKLE